MEDLFKKFVYTSVGVVAYTAEKIRETVDQLIAEEKISAEEGKKIVDELIANTEAKKEEFEAQLRVLVEKVVASVKVPTLGGGSSAKEEIEDLKARIEALEAKTKASKSKKEEAATEA